MEQELYEHVIREFLDTDYKWIKTNNPDIIFDEFNKLKIELYTSEKVSIKNNQHILYSFRDKDTPKIIILCNDKEYAQSIYPKFDKIEIDLAKRYIPAILTTKIENTPSYIKVDNYNDRLFHRIKILYHNSKLIHLSNLNDGDIINHGLFLEGVQNVKFPKESLIVGGHVCLARATIKRLPKTFCIYGNLDLSYTDIEDLSKYNLKVTNGINLRFSAIKKLPNELNLAGDLILDYTKVEKLPDKLTIDGYLNLENTRIKKLPEELQITGDLYLNKSYVTKLPENMVIGGDLNLIYSPVKKLPKELTVGGNLNLCHSDITEIPDDIEVERKIIISNKNMKISDKFKDQIVYR